MAKKPCGTYIVKDIPESDVGKCMAGFNLQDPKSCTSKKQADGKWTVTAVFEDCPPGKPNVTEKTHD